MYMYVRKQNAVINSELGAHQLLQTPFACSFWILALSEYADRLLHSHVLIYICMYACPHVLHQLNLILCHQRTGSLICFRKDIHSALLLANAQLKNIHMFMFVKMSVNVYACM